MPQLRVNDRQHTIDADPQMPLLWVIRDNIGLTGTRARALQRDLRGHR